MRLRDDNGSVTVEYALTLPVVVALLGFIVSVGMAASARTTACEGARTVARQVAVGTDIATAGSQIRQNLDAALSVQASVTGDWVRVKASKPLVGTLAWTGLVASCSASAWRQSNE